MGAFILSLLFFLFLLNVYKRSPLSNKIAVKISVDLKKVKHHFLMTSNLAKFLFPVKKKLLNPQTFIEN